MKVLSPSPNFPCLDVRGGVSFFLKIYSSPRTYLDVKVYNLAIIRSCIRCNSMRPRMMRRRKSLNHAVDPTPTHYPTSLASIVNSSELDPSKRLHCQSVTRSAPHNFVKSSHTSCSLSAQSHQLRLRSRTVSSTSSVVHRPKPRSTPRRLLRTVDLSIQE